MIFPRWISHSQPTSPENRRCCHGNKRIATTQTTPYGEDTCDDRASTFCRNANRHCQIFGVILADYIHVSVAIDCRLCGE